MAQGARSGILITFGAFLLIASFYPNLAKTIMDEAQFKWPDIFRAESVKEQQLHPDVLLPKQSEAPFGLYMFHAIQAILPEQLARQRKKRWFLNKTGGNSLEKGEAQFVEDERMAKPQPGDRQGGGSALRKFIKSNQKKRLKRSFSYVYTDENSLDDKYLSSMLKTKEQKRIESHARMFRKKREEAEVSPSILTVHFRITALEAQETLTKMIDLISDPSNPISKGKRLAYMRELQNELSTFMKHLQQKIQLQSPEEDSSMTTTTTPPAT